MSGNFKYKEFGEFVKSFENANLQFELFLQRFILRMAKDLIERAQEKTPVDTGLLKGSYRVKNVQINGGEIIATVENIQQYASHVEYGHGQEVGQFVPFIGKRLKKAWVSGNFMLTISSKELENALPASLEGAFLQFLQLHGVGR